MVKFLVIAALTASLITGQVKSHPRFGKYWGPASVGYYHHDPFVRLKPFLSHFNVIPDHRSIYCFVDHERGLYLYAGLMTNTIGIV